jgi:hypothetical protein
MEILLVHLVGEFLLQNNWMDVHKDDSSWPCIVHVLIYSALCFFFIPGITLLHIPIIAALHFIVDRFAIARSFVTRAREGKRDRMITYAVDNTIHLVTLYLVISYV